MPTLNKMTSDGNYPSNDGIRVGLQSVVSTAFRPTALIDIDLAIAGTIGGGSPSYQIQVLDRDGNWRNASGLSLTAAGVVSGTVEGCSVRLVAANGTSPGTGANAPRYHLNTRVRGNTTINDYTG